jgi:hypothetical protein
MNLIGTFALYWPLRFGFLFFYRLKRRGEREKYTRNPTRYAPFDFDFLSDDPFDVSLTATEFVMINDWQL